VTASGDSICVAQWLADGRAAIERVEALGPFPAEVCRVCFHFYCPDDADQDRWGDDAECVRLSRPLFEAMPFEISVDGVGGVVGIEAWEQVWPTVPWLEDRIPRMIEVARKSSMEFNGWSFEPKNGPIVSAGRQLNVVGANTPEGRATMAGLIESLKTTKH
jgi:hypothetical protein